MRELNFQQALVKILARDRRFHRDAYFFVREALDFTQTSIAKANRGQARHVTGQELLVGIREYALKQYGPMSHLVLQEWGVNSCEDFGEIVFNMIKDEVLAKTEQDSLDDFKGGYRFEEAFRQPFLPSDNPTGPEPHPNPNHF